jgi:hypothetical protein
MEGGRIWLMMIMSNYSFCCNGVEPVVCTSSELVGYSLDIVFLEVSDEEISHIRGDLLNLDRFLGPYPFDTWKRWKDLTSKVTGMCNVCDTMQYYVTPFFLVVLCQHSVRLRKSHKPLVVVIRYDEIQTVYLLNASHYSSTKQVGVAIML